MTSVKNKNQEKYYIYIIACEGDKYYTGITTDYKRRFAEHLHKNGDSKGAKFTKCFKPQKILALWVTLGRSNALKLEAKIKNLTKIKKNVLINDKSAFKEYFSEKLDISLYKRKGKYA